MEKVLIIDDDQMMCKAMASVIQGMECHVSYCCTLKEGFKIATSDEFDVVILDVMMPDGSGLDLLPQIKEMRSSPEVIIITAYGDPDGAELAIKCGAWDYIEKKASIKEILLPLSRALQYRKEKRAANRPVALKRENIIGVSPKMNACFDLMAKASISDANALITGETGTGKELFAHAIHENSQRSGNNFVIVDCATLPESLVESVLFGHEKGSFTG
ncbi:sigma-54-dependent transcriptional regulator, partial [Thermodesulfobacteriota bacterium]